MSLGTQISTARRAKKMTQAKLAEILGVSPEAVSKWEQDKYVPSPDKLKLMDEKIGLSLYEDDGSIRNVRLYDEDHMSAFLKGKMNAGSFPEASRALTFAKEKHAGSYRSPREARIPYINHPLTMACHAFAMGLEEDVIMAAIFLHDVVEDCHVRADELPVSSEIQRIVALVSKPPKPFSEKEYYNRIMTDPRACLVKCIDRCNNLSSMSLGFSDMKIAEYVEETETYYPDLLRVVKECPEYNNVAWLLSYQIRSLIAMAKRIY